MLSPQQALEVTQALIFQAISYYFASIYIEDPVYNSEFYLDMEEDADKISLDVLDGLMGNPPGLSNTNAVAATAPSETHAPASQLYPDLNALALGS